MLTNFSAFLIDFDEMSASAKPPSGRVTPCRACVPRTSTSSSEPPPRSPTMPSARCTPEMTPSAVSSASRVPDSTSILVPMVRFGELDEGRAVLGVAAGGGGDGERFLHAHGLAQRAKALERRERVLHRVGGEKLRRLHLAAETAQRLLVENLGRAAGQPFIDDKAHGIRADVDDGDRRTVVEASLSVGFSKRHRSQSAQRPVTACSAADHGPRIIVAGIVSLGLAAWARQGGTRDPTRFASHGVTRPAHTGSGRCRNRGMESFGDLPRPDRLGLVMK